jgi:hypothetical protein
VIAVPGNPHHITGPVLIAFSLDEGIALAGQDEIAVVRVLVVVKKSGAAKTDLTDREKIVGVGTCCRGNREREGMGGNMPQWSRREQIIIIFYKSFCHFKVLLKIVMKDKLFSKLGWFQKKRWKTGARPVFPLSGYFFKT